MCMVLVLVGTAVAGWDLFTQVKIVKGVGEEAWLTGA